MDHDTECCQVPIDSASAATRSVPACQFKVPSCSSTIASQSHKREPKIKTSTGTIVFNELGESSDARPDYRVHNGFAGNEGRVGGFHFPGVRRRSPLPTNCPMSWTENDQYNAAIQVKSLHMAKDGSPLLGIATKHQSWMVASDKILDLSSYAYFGSPPEKLDCYLARQHPVPGCLNSPTGCDM